MFAWRGFLRVSALLSCGLAACEADDASTQRQAPAGPPALAFDFGTIPHGEAREHDFVLDSRTELGPDYYPLGTYIDCSCARVRTLLRDAQGREREIAVHGPDQFPAAGEVVVIRMLVDSAHKEAVDVGPIASRAMVQFQSRRATDTSTRLPWAITFRYAIDAPVRLRPFAVLDFARVPPSVPGQLVTTLASDLPDRKIAFGPVRCDDPRIALRLQEQDGLTRLYATFTPQHTDAGHVRALVSVGTDLDSGYVVKLAAMAEVVPDLLALPIAKISLRADLRRPQAAENAQSQYLIVTDHDRRRPAEFRMARFVDNAGVDARDKFEVAFTEVPGDEHSRRLHLRWIGQQASEFRGELVLAKDVDNGPFLTIAVVALHSAKP